MERKFKNLQIALSAMVILAFLAMPFTTYAQAGKANFAGSWTYNAEKSQAGQPQGQPPQGAGQGQGQRGGFGGGNMVAKQEANLLTVERTRTGQDGQATTTSLKYTLDGKESVNPSQMGDSKSVATWSADGKTLTIVTNRTFERDGQTTTMKTTEEWSLTSPTALTIKSTRTSPNGDRVTTAVYDKK